MLQKINKKRGVSTIIGYVLLISMAIALAGVTYVWMKSFVPKEKIECPDGTSIVIKSYAYDCASKNLTLILKNNGRYDIAGYFIKATNSSNQTIAVLDLKNYLIEGPGIVKFNSSILLSSGNNNSFSPNQEIVNRFNLTSSNYSDLYSIEIIPTRWQKEKRGYRLVSCQADAKAEEILSCA